MAARQHSRFVHFVLPWVIAAAGLVLYLTSLHPWVSFDSVGLVSRVAGWEWNTLQLGPVTLLVTWPVRWLPEASRPLALNVLSAALAALTLGLLAKSVALLPHDRTREQRQRERSDFSFLSAPLAWVPPVAAAGLLAFQLTFWEHATAMTGEMISLTLFAVCVFCFLRFRVMGEDKYLAALAFTFGAAAANDWGMIGFCPLFFAAIVWGKGIAFFESRFLIRTTLAGLAGTLFYLIPPLVLKISGQADASLLEILRTNLGFQRQLLFAFPRWALLFCGLASILPMLFMGIRWPSTFGDMSAAGAALTNVLFRSIHVAFFVFCAWVMFDPPFSPRERGFGLPFLHFYFLSALAVGYAIGYIILVFGQEPERRIKKVSDGLIALGRMVSVLAALAALVAVGALAFHNHRAIKGQNGTLTRDLAANLVPPAATPSPVLLSDDNALLMLAVGAMHAEGRTNAIPISSEVLKFHVYQSHHEKLYGTRWPALAIERLSNPIGDDILLQQAIALTYTNRLVYLHPSFGFFFESFHLLPGAPVYPLVFQTTNTFRHPPLEEARLQETHQFWDGIRKRYVEEPALERMREQRVTDAERVGTHYSRGLNHWGVVLQRLGRTMEAATFFKAALELNRENLAAKINLQFNENLRAGKSESVVIDKELDDQLGRYRDLPTFLLMSGPVDEPTFCFRLGRVFSQGGLARQAADQFARALELQPSMLEARLWLANAALSAQIHDEVFRQVAVLRDETSRLTPAQRLEVAAMESWAHFHTGDLAAAERLLSSVQKEYPERSEPLQILNDIYVAADNTNAALRTADQLISRLPNDPRPLVKKSAILLRTGAHEEAVEVLSRALSKDPALVPALLNRGLALIQLGRLDDAERDYLKLLEVAPQLNAVHYHLGEIEYRRGRGAEARRHYLLFLKQALPGSPDARAVQERLEAIAAGRMQAGG